MKARPSKKKKERESKREYIGGGGEGFYRISCLACSHFSPYNPSVLQSELFGCPGR